MKFLIKNNEKFGALGITVPNELRYRKKPLTALIIVSATPRHFCKARQELAALKQLAGLYKNALARPAHYTGLAETMIKAPLTYGRKMAS